MPVGMKTSVEGAFEITVEDLPLRSSFPKPGSFAGMVERQGKLIVCAEAPDAKLPEATGVPGELAELLR